MIAMTKNDKCFSVGNGNSPFNTDKQPRDTISVDEARASFDYEIQKHKCFTEDGREIPNLYHLQCDDGVILPCHGVSESFEPVNHRDVFDYIVKEVLPAVPNLQLETAGTIRGRSVGLFQANWNGAFSIKGDKSPHEMRLFFANPTNGTGSFTMGFCLTRIVCENTLRMAWNEAKKDGVRICHTPNCKFKIENVVHQIAEQAEAAKELKSRYERLAAIGVDSKTMKKCLDAVYPLYGIPEDTHAYTRLKNLRDEVVRQFEDGETAQSFYDKRSALALFNSFTYPIFNPDERKLERSKTKDRAEIAYKGLNGSVQERVEKIFNKVEAIV